MNETLLIIDDDIDTLKLVGLMLERQGYNVLAAHDGFSGIQTAVDKQPDLILLDVGMPRMDGYETARKIREAPSTAEIPIIMLTARNDLDDKVTGFEAGVDDYLTKPTQPRELVAHIRAVLTRSAKTKPQQTSRPIPQRGRVIGVMAAKGGVGVSAFALRLGLSLNEDRQQEVIVAEYRPGQGSLGLYLGYDQHYPNLLTLLEIPPDEIGPRQVQECLIPYEEQIQIKPSIFENAGKANIKLLLSSFQPRHTHFISQTEPFCVITRILSHMAGYVILDLGPSLPPITEKVLEQCDEVVVLATPLLFTIIQTGELLTDLANMGFEKERVKVVLIDAPVALDDVPFTSQAIERGGLRSYTEERAIGTPAVMSPSEVEDYLHLPIITEAGGLERPIRKLVFSYLDLFKK
jgi:CheY-like chemotaxis protein/MinD-like ATPase involved in chromosome partitioning or flagellar assembly